jgi:hypothetical protein
MPTDFQSYVQECVVKILDTERSWLTTIGTLILRWFHKDRTEPWPRAKLSRIGTGFWVLPHYCLTCLHNLENSLDNTVWIQYGDDIKKAFYKKELSCSENDIAVLEVPEMEGKVLPLGRAPRKDIRVRAFGFRRDWPGGGGFTANGMLRYGQRMEGAGPVDTFETELPPGSSLAGMSGCPIFDPERAIVVGIQHAEEEKGPSISYVHTLDQIVGSWPDLLPSNEAAVSELRFVGEIREGSEDYLEAVSVCCDQAPYEGLRRRVRSLSDVYIEQLITEQPDKEAAGPESRPGADAGQITPTATTLERALDLHSNLILEGPPGIGKSSMLRHLASTLAKRWNLDLRESLVPVLVSAPTLASSEGALGERLYQASQEIRGYLHKELPRNFFEQRISAGAKWVVLVDGLDEVVGPLKLHKLFTLFDRWASHSAPYSFVVSSRPFDRSGLEQTSERFTRYSVQPWTVALFEKFARRWFETESDGSVAAESFIQRVREGLLGDLMQFPLLATMAAVVFDANRKRMLPTNRADLYGRFVDELLADRRGSSESFVGEWRSQAPRTGEGCAETLLENRRKLLQVIALGLRTADRKLALAWRGTPAAQWTKFVLVSQGTESLLQRALNYAGEQKWLPESVRDKDWLKTQMANLLRGTGLVTGPQENLQFIHESFREYLAACELADEYKDKDDETVWSALTGGLEALPLRFQRDPDQRKRLASAGWNEKAWREVALYWLAIWSQTSDGEKPRRDVSPLVQRSHTERDLSLAADALAAGAKVSDAVEESVVQGLAERARQTYYDHGIKRLGRIAGSRRAQQALQALASDPSIDSRWRLDVAAALTRQASGYPVGEAKQRLLSAAEETVRSVLKGTERGSKLGPDQECDSLFVSAAVALARLLGRHGEAQSRLMELAWDSHADMLARFDAIRALVEMAPKEIAIDALEKGIRAWEPGWCKKLIERLAQLGQTELLSKLMQDSGLDSAKRIELARVVGSRCGRGHDAAPLLMSFLDDAGLPVKERITAARALGRELGRSDAAAPALLSCLRDEQLSEEVRINAAEALGEIGRAADAAPVLYDLAKIARELPPGPFVKGLGLAREAVKTLGFLDCWQELAQLARAASVYPEIRTLAAQAWGRRYQGSVRDVEHRQVFLSFGKRNGLQPGTEIELYRKGNEVDDQDKHWGGRIYAETSLGRGRVDETFDDHAIASLLSGEGQVAPIVSVGEWVQFRSADVEQPAAALLDIICHSNAAPFVLAMAARAMVRLGRTDGLVAFARLEEVEDWIQEREVVGLLNRLGRVDVLERLAQDKSVKPYVRSWAARRIPANDELETATRAWRAIANDPTVEHRSREEATDKLVELGCKEEAAELYLSFLRNHDLSDLGLLLVPDKLAKIGRSDDVAALLANWIRDHPSEWVEALSPLNALEALHRQSELVALAKDGRLHANTRENAIRWLGESGSNDLLEDLNQLANHDPSEQVRVEAQKAVEAIRARSRE